LKSLEELKNELATAYGNKWRTDAYNFFAYDAFKQGFDAAIKAVSERENKLLNALLSYQGQIARVYGDKIPDAFKIPYSFAEEALKDYASVKAKL